ncbi:unnamed protein product [Hydatigera taeniaeformis]|uniref:Uncharacterized protein n=1 Tax=Hydatigena taeniaeformis TaxID=6205 RepID=A0A3P7HIS6_HYDTA|nr:unnamed protein product [Hydatigera taeniaeformis]
MLTNDFESQFARGGGTLCVQDPKIWKLFYKLVIQIEACPHSGISAPQTIAAISQVRIRLPR